MVEHYGCRIVYKVVSLKGIRTQRRKQKGSVNLLHFNNLEKQEPSKLRINLKNEIANIRAEINKYSLKPLINYLQFRERLTLLS